MPIGQNWSTKIQPIWIRLLSAVYFVNKVQNVALFSAPTTHSRDGLSGIAWEFWVMWGKVRIWWKSLFFLLFSLSPTVFRVTFTAWQLIVRWDWPQLSQNKAIWNCKLFLKSEFHTYWPVSGIRQVGISGFYSKNLAVHPVFLILLKAKSFFWLFVLPICQAAYPKPIIWLTQAETSLVQLPVGQVLYHKPNVLQ